MHSGSLFRYEFYMWWFGFMLNDPKKFFTRVIRDHIRQLNFHNIFSI